MKPSSSYLGNARLIWRLEELLILQSSNSVVKDFFSTVKYVSLHHVIRHIYMSPPLTTLSRFKNIAMQGQHKVAFVVTSTVIVKPYTAIAVHCINSVIG
jgi:hypothetical protein